MKCPQPITVRMKSTDNIKDKMQVPCGKCPICLERRRSNWSFRMQRELKEHTSASFVTLTIDDRKIVEKYGSMELSKELSKPLIQNFLKRVRKEIPYPIRYYIVGEYGPKTLRPHYHGIIFGLKRDDRQQFSDIWGIGNVKHGDVNAKSIHYVCGYVIQKFEFLPKKQQPFSLMSRRPGIGNGYVETHGKYHKDTQNTFVTYPGGIKGQMPRYYKDKIFTKTEQIYHGIQSLKAEEKLYNQNRDRIEKLGNNYHNYVLEQSNQKQNQIIKRLKSKKL
mgnify:CR=1 FL=1